jgi:hypothetical protein
MPSGLRLRGRTIRLRNPVVRFKRTRSRGASCRCEGGKIGTGAARGNVTWRIGCFLANTEGLREAGEVAKMPQVPGYVLGAQFTEAIHVCACD